MVAAMAKGSGYACTECGKTALTWTGQCPGCGAWNTLEAAAPAPARPSARRTAPAAAAQKPVKLRSVSMERADRMLTGIAELDRVLGGGFVPG